MISKAVLESIKGHTYIAKLFERDLAILVLVGKENRLVHDLLQLGVLKIVAHHHLKYLEKFSVRDEPIVVHVIDSEGN